MTGGILLLFVVVLGRYAVHEIAGLRAALLATRAEQILLSARDWSHAHAEQLNAADKIELPLDDLIPSMASGRLELRYADAPDGVAARAPARPDVIECRLTITQARRTVTRHVYWPASVPVRP